MPRLTGKNKSRNRRLRQLSGKKSRTTPKVLRYADGRPVQHLVHEFDGSCTLIPVCDPRDYRFEKLDYTGKLLYASSLFRGLERPIPNHLFEILEMVWLELKKGYDGREKPPIYLDLEVFFKEAKAA